MALCCSCYILFQHTAARRRLGGGGRPVERLGSFNTQPPEGGWLLAHLVGPVAVQFQHTAARRRLGHSVKKLGSPSSFNTQPPEGGWTFALPCMPKPPKFQHTAARRRLAALHKPAPVVGRVSTHSRPKAAGRGSLPVSQGSAVSTHSRPKAAGLTRATRCRACRSFNTQPPEGGWSNMLISHLFFRRFNTQPPEGGWLAAPEFKARAAVSTHSRPKAAGGNHG